MPFLRAREKEVIHISKMNQKKLNIFKEIFQDVGAAFNGTKKIYQMTEVMFSREKLSVEQVIYFPCEGLFCCKLRFGIKNNQVLLKKGVIKA